MTRATEKRVLAAARRLYRNAEWYAVYVFGKGHTGLCRIETDEVSLRGYVRACAADAAARKRRKVK